MQAKMIHIIITSYKEPKATIRAVNAFLRQKTKEKFKIIVCDPFPEVEKQIKKEIKDKRVSFFLDPGEGKSYALNLLLERIYSGDEKDIIVLSDGDVYVSDNALQEMVQAFKDEKVGCVTGRPVALDSKDEKYGYWAHFAFSGIDKARRKISSKNKFMECSGYLFAIRNSVLQGFPLETSEDSIIPYLFWKKGYRIVYSPNAEVYVKNPGNWADYRAQKVRNIKAHENLNKIAPDLPRTKSLWNEIKHGWYFFFIYPRKAKEFLWTIELYFARLYIYLRAFSELRKKKSYNDGWRGEALTESTKTLD
jgi:cellulose synthase/poly-beta-1,6-N-acetylglucosamine synthase-like glycosyltransferase